MSATTSTHEQTEQTVQTGGPDGSEEREAATPAPGRGHRAERPARSRRGEPAGRARRRARDAQDPQDTRTDGDAGHGDRTRPSTGGAPRGRRLVPALAALAVVLAVAGGLALRQADSVRDVPAAQNDALVDPAGTAEVESAVAAALTKVLSYDHRTPEETRAAAEQVLGGRAADEYAQLVATLEERAPDQQLVMQAQVDVVGVKRLSDDEAELLVFLDQSSTRSGDGESNVAAAQVAVTAERTDGEWIVVGLSPL